MKAPTHFKFRLYVAGDGPNSAQAVANLNDICREHLPERHEIEVIDVLREQKRALADGVMLTPLLVKLSPAPVQRITGTLSWRELVLHALNLPIQPQ
jgi:circadian clock protein KaiB